MPNYSIRTQNPNGGFYRTLKNANQPATKWFDRAARLLAKDFDLDVSTQSELLVRFLDSSTGRHLADMVVESGNIKTVVSPRGRRMFWSWQDYE